MLVYGSKYKKLGEIEKVTKNGHGMATFGDVESGLNDFYVGVLGQRLFQAWFSHRGVDVKGFPENRRKAEPSAFKISLNRLLYCIPELENILMEVDEEFHPKYVFSNYDITGNAAGFPKERYYQRKYSGSYVNMIDMFLKAEEDLIQHISGRIIVVGDYKDPYTSSAGWRTFVLHEANFFMRCRLLYDICLICGHGSQKRMLKDLIKWLLFGKNFSIMKCRPDVDT